MRSAFYNFYYHTFWIWDQKKNGIAYFSASKKGCKTQSLTNNEGKLPLFSLMFSETFVVLHRDFLGHRALLLPLYCPDPRSLVSHILMTEEFTSC